ncbi:MAG: alpha/beta fold hydrolase [Myxococcaceae bacterium]|nr:alpha/beta fold hydrolase [Myxococcaceae bacterium]
MQPATPRDPPRQTLELPGVTLSYTDEGTGPVVVGLSGLPGAHHHWRWLGTPLFEWARFVRLELPGFGDSRMQGAVKPLSLRARGELIARVLEALKLSRVHLVGHSMGGMHALETAVHHAGLVRSVTLVACPGFTAHYPENAWRLVAGLFELAPLQRPLASLSRLAFKRLGFSVRDMHDEGALRTVIDAAHTSFDRHRKNIAEVCVPVLQSWADDDELVPRRFHEGLARQRPDWATLRFSDGGHDVQKFHGVELAEAMRQLAGGADGELVTRR